MNWKNAFADKLNIDFPFVQAPMLGITSPQMVASVSNTGCMGSLPLGLTNNKQAQALIQAVKQQTSKPFSVNLFVYKSPSIERTPSMEILKSFYNRYGLPFPESLIAKNPFPVYEDLIQLLIEENIPAVSFTFGIPTSDIVTRLKSSGCVLIGSASCVEEAKLIEESGMDIVVVQGIEAGGHRASFMEGTLPQTGLISLLPQVIDAVTIPVIAAGGLMEGRSIAAALILGAQGVQLGSAFIRSTESVASKAYKASVAASTDTSTVLTNAWTGRYARGIKNGFITEMQNEEILPYPFQIYYTDQIRKKGKEQDSETIQAFWAGQSSKFAKDKNAGVIMSELIKDTERILEKAKELF